mgnify:FL=1|jgi:hypothetical protein
MDPHGQWKTKIEIRNADLTENWWPFVENINDILERMQEYQDELESIRNKNDETMGLIRGLYKSFIRMDIFDKEWKLNWTAVKRIGEMINEEREEEDK